MPYKDPITRIFVQIDDENLPILDSIARVERKTRGSVLREVVNGMLANAREVLSHKDIDAVVDSALDVTNKAADEMKRELFFFQSNAKQKQTRKSSND